MSKYNSVVLEANTPFDEVCAKVVLERLMVPVAELPVAAFWAETTCSPAQKLAWEQEGIFPVELGDEKYFQTPGCYSVMEWVSRHFGVEITQHTFGEQRLLQMLADHNGRNGRGKGGLLKKPKMAIPSFMRHLYDLGFDPHEVVRRVSGVVHVFLRSEDGERRDDRTDGEMAQIFETMLPMLEVSQCAPFTPHRYLRDLWRLGCEESEIREKVTWWMDAYWKVQRAKSDAKVAFDNNLPKVEFQLRGGILCVGIETADPFIMDAAVRVRDILVVKNPTNGHCAILTNQKSGTFDFSALVAEFNRIEPGIWYYHQVAGRVINGGKIYYKAPATARTLVELIGLIERFAPHRLSPPQRSRQQVRT